MSHCVYLDSNTQPCVLAAFSLFKRAPSIMRIAAAESSAYSCSTHNIPAACDARHMHASHANTKP